MIYTRFGSPVTIIDTDEDQQRVTLLFSDGYTTKTSVNELKADGGLQEIQIAIDEI